MTAVNTSLARNAQVGTGPPKSLDSISPSDSPLYRRLPTAKVMSDDEHTADERSAPAPTG